MIVNIFTPLLYSVWNKHQNPLEATTIIKYIIQYIQYKYPVLFKNFSLFCKTNKRIFTCTNTFYIPNKTVCVYYISSLYL